MALIHALRALSDSATAAAQFISYLSQPLLTAPLQFSADFIHYCCLNGVFSAITTSQIPRKGPLNRSFLRDIPSSRGWFLLARAIVCGSLQILTPSPSPSSESPEHQRSMRRHSKPFGRRMNCIAGFCQGWRCRGRCRRSYRCRASRWSSFLCFFSIFLRPWELFVCQKCWKLHQRKVLFQKLKQPP